jgi:putative heme-binding domain-containing protein
MGHAGGLVGPDLSHIGEARTERDLLESILYPSLSFVRSYEPVLVVTADGRTINGTVVDETESEYVLATGVDQQIRLRRDEVDELEPSLVSIMPGGLDGQLSVQEMADLVAFLKNATGK